jgi:signal transduction histidine kinase
MLRWRESRSARWGVALPAVAAALALTAALPPPEPCPPSLFFAAVLLSAWWGGLGPGLLATGLSVLALDFFFLPPVYSLGVGLADATRLGVFVLVALLTSSLTEARRRLTDALRLQNRRKDDFLAVLAHELRTPLSAVLCAAEVLRLPGAGREAGRAAELVARQARQMARLIDDLLDVSRIGRGKVRLEKRAVDVGEAVARAAEAVRPQIQARRHRLEVSLTPEPVCVEADPARLEQILVNLLANAARYTDPGGVIWLTAERVGREVRLRVRDTGVGLDPRTLPHLFDLFGQARPGAGGGLGVGLSLVRALAELHGGAVEALSDGPGRGSEFVVRLPACPREGLAA